MQTSEEVAVEDTISSHKSRIGHLATLIKHLPPGDVADLRRSADVEMPGPSFWKIFITLPDYDQKQRVEEWQTILVALTYMKDLHTPAVSLGNALFLAGYSEARLTKLLNAKDKTLRSEITTVARFLGSKGQLADLNQLANLILITGDGNQKVRRSIAKDFYFNQ